MKKLCLLLACILGLSITTATAQANEAGMPPKEPPCHGGHMHDGPKMPPPDFSKLKLTDEQKAKLDENRNASREKMKPIFEQMQKDKTKIQVIQSSTKLTDEQKVEQITAVKKEIRELRKQANEIRQEDMKFFESQLTNKQKKTFEKIKQDQKKQMDKARKSKGCPVPSTKPKQFEK